MLDILAALVPSIGVGLLFWFAIRAIISADRRERAAVTAFDKADAEKAGASGSPIPDSSRPVSGSPDRTRFDGRDQ